MDRYILYASQRDHQNEDVQQDKFLLSLQFLPPLADLLLQACLHLRFDFQPQLLLQNLWRDRRTCRENMSNVKVGKKYTKTCCEHLGIDPFIHKNNSLATKVGTFEKPFQKQRFSENFVCIQETCCTAKCLCENEFM